jgi:hypothetical protein
LANTIPIAFVVEDVETAAKKNYFSAAVEVDDYAGRFNSVRFTAWKQTVSTGRFVL